MSRYKDGKAYENFINKFIKGTNVSSIQDYYDLETKNFIYEIKGTKLQEKGKSSLGRYKIFIDQIFLVTKIYLVVQNTFLHLFPNT